MKKLSLILLAVVAMVMAGCVTVVNNENTNENNNETTMNTTMNDLLTRRSVRSYTDEVPPMEVIEEICMAGTYAPTGMNRQAPIIIAVTNREVRDRLSKLNASVFGPDNDSDPFYGAPVVLVVLADTTAAPTWKEDGSLVMGNLLNACHAKGLGSCWIHRANQMFKTEEGKAYLRKWGLDESLDGWCSIALGYADMEPAPPKPRKEGYYRIIK